MKRLWTDLQVRALVAGALLTIGLNLPWQLKGEAWSGALALSAEVALCCALLWLMTLRAEATDALFGTWRSRLLGVLWIGLWSFEVARLVGFTTMGQDPILYDGLALSFHLFVLGRDLYGPWAALTVVGAVATLALLSLLSVALFARIEVWMATDRRASGLTVLVLLLALAHLSTLSRDRWPALWVGPDLARNLIASVDLHHRSRIGTTGGAYDALEALQLQKRPDVRIYIIESYGGVVLEDERLTEGWMRSMGEVDHALRAHGWNAASGRSVAPVSGGRSWIADASLFLGQHVAHHSRYQYLMSVVDTLPHLPGYLASQGYHTVLVRPKDKARPGIRLQNFFGFQTTVFHDDLPYTGRIAGWGKIPDQYTIGYVDEEVLEPLQGPTFSFFHLVTGHFPWDAQADPVWDWRRLNDIQTGPQVRYRQRDVLSELRMHVRRYRRDEGPVTPPRALTESQHIEYLRAVNYGIASVAQQLIQNPPERPTLVLIMGDHQPPLLAADLGFEVPVHAYATDPALLEGFLEHGFAPGWLPAAGSIRHEGLFSLLVGALALADGQRPPPYLPEGIPGMRAP